MFAGAVSAMEEEFRDMSRAELISAIERISTHIREDTDIGETVQKLRIYQEETRAQTEQILASQQEIEQSRDRYAELYDFAPVAFLTFDSNGIIQEINLTGATMLGIERQRILGSPVLSYVDERSRRAMLGHLHRCRVETGMIVTEIKLRPVQGERIDAQFSTRSHPERGFSRSAVIDLSDRHRSEEERRALVEREKSALEAGAAKDRFVAALSHELRTPLTPVMAALGALESDPDLAARLRPTVGMIRRNIELEAQLIEDLLDVTRITQNKLTLHRKTVDMHELINQTLETCAVDLADKNLSVDTEMSAEGPYVDGDPIRLRQVLWNLMKNAVKFTPTGGKIGVKTVNPKPAMLRVSVTDTGIGFAPEAAERIFRAFEQDAEASHYGGLGLGLSIAKGVIDAHGGAIHAVSAGRHKGATFDVDLPVAAAPVCAAESPAAPAMPVAPAHAPARKRGMHLLLVEDHRDTARVLSRLLSAAGFDVSIADSVQSALPLAAGNCDLIISDLGLPDGTGFDLIKKVLETRTVRSIALSGYATEDDVRRSKEAGFNEHLAKPIDFQKLLRVIDQVAEGAPAAT